MVPRRARSVPQQRRRSDRTIWVSSPWPTGRQYFPCAAGGPCPRRTPSLQTVPETPRPIAGRFSPTVRVTASSLPSESARSPDVRTRHGPPAAIVLAAIPPRQGPQPDKTSFHSPPGPLGTDPDPGPRLRNRGYGTGQKVTRRPHATQGRNVSCLGEMAGFEPRTLGYQAERIGHCATRPRHARHAPLSAPQNDSVLRPLDGVQASALRHVHGPDPTQV
jgi:hypothetical protein